MLHYTLWQLRKINKSTLIDKILFSSHKRSPGSRDRTEAQRSAASCVKITQLHGRARIRVRRASRFSVSFRRTTTCLLKRARFLGTGFHCFPQYDLNLSINFPRMLCPGPVRQRRRRVRSRLRVRYRRGFFLNCALFLQLLNRAFPGSMPCGRSVPFGVRKTYVSWLYNSLALW